MKIDYNYYTEDKKMSEQEMRVYELEKIVTDLDLLLTKAFKNDLLDDKLALQLYKQVVANVEKQTGRPY